MFCLGVSATDGVGHNALNRHIVAHPELSGLLVEPLPDMFAKLRVNYPAHRNLFFENSAITDRDGETEITRIPEVNLDGGCPTWTDGIYTLQPNIHIIEQRPELKSYSVRLAIRTTTFVSLEAKFAIDRVDHLQIDVEGNDKEVFDQIWNTGFRPSIIKLEIDYLIKFVTIMITDSQVDSPAIAPFMFTRLLYLLTNQ